LRDARGAFCEEGALVNPCDLRPGLYRRLRRSKRSRCENPSRFGAIGVEFIDENGGGPGVRLRHLQQQKRQAG